MEAIPRVLLLTDPGMGGHQPPGHPERPERLGAASTGVIDGAAAAGAVLQAGRVEAAGRAAMERIHPGPYLDLLEDAARLGGGWIDADTYLGPGSLIAARLAAGATIQAAEAVSRDEADVAFAAVRPPGHHARPERAAGFCLLNNVALAVMTLRAAGLAQRIAIVDWDVHHGDGTQAIFDADPELCYVSTHQMPLYPGSGAANEQGTGPGAGTKHNVPLQPGSGDEPFIAAWTTQLLPAVEAFAPQAILVSAGYDAHRDDPLAELRVTAVGFGQVSEALGELVRRLGLPGVALTLEGGYDLEALHDGVAATIVGFLAGLTGRNVPEAILDRTR